MTERFTPTSEYGTSPPEPTIEAETILERHPEWPRLNVLFHFGSHDTQKDFESAAPHVKRAHIYLMENIHADSAMYCEILQRWVADVRFIPKAVSNLLVDSRLQPITNELHGSGKAIGVIDLPPGAQKLRKELLAAMAEPLPVDDSLKESAEHLGEILARCSELHEQREQLAVQAFENEIGRILEERPELKENPELNVVITMGAYHTRLRHSLTKAGVASERNFPTHPTFTYSYTNEAIRTYAYGRVPEEELLEKAWIEYALSMAITRTLEGYEGSSIAMDQYERVLTGKLTHDQRVEIYEIIKRDPAFSDETVGKIDTYLQRNELGRLPRSTEEIDPTFRRSSKRSLARRALSALMCIK